MRTLVVGAGAVGGYFGGRLVEAKRDVTFLVRSRRQRQISSEGLQIISPHGNLTLHPQTIAAGRLQKKFDLIFLGVKGYTLEDAMNDFAPAVGPETMIFPALNGMRHMDLLSDRFGRQAVLGGVCLVATEVDTQGKIRQLADMQALIYGELDGQKSARIATVDKHLSGAGFDTSLSAHVLQEMWQKWVQLSSLGAVNCLLRGNIGEIAVIAGGAATAVALIRECAAIAESCGYPQTPEFLKKQTEALTAEGSSFTSSMYRDLVGGAPVEADAIIGDLLGRGEEHGLESPLLRAALVNLSVYQRRRETAANIKPA